MKISSDPKFSYYGLLLKTYLRDNFPDKADDNSFIRSRAEEAAEAYSNAILDGYGHDKAGEEASDTLFNGLHFSPYNTILDILWNEFATEVPQSLAPYWSLILLRRTTDVFEHYPLTDDFAFTPDYDLLYTELTGNIQLMLEEYGLQ